MSGARLNPWRAVLATELFLYGIVVGGFLWLYVVRFREPVGVVPYHVAILLSLLLLVWSIRGLTWVLAGRKRVFTAFVAVLIVFPAMMLVIWYSAMLVGLDSWGRVATWPLIRSYVTQAPYLLGVLGVSPWIPFLILIVFASIVVFLVARYVVPYDWLRHLTSLGTRSGVISIALALAASAALLVHVQVQAGAGNPREPFAVSFLSSGSGMQSHFISGSAVLAERERAARNAYSPSSARSSRNLVIVVGDALRADHMSIYGYGRKTTPRLAEVISSQQGVVVPNVRAACAESSCGLMALAASRPVSKIGVAPLTLQEVLRRNGRQVNFILSGDHTNFYGLKDMYGELDGFFDGSQQMHRYMNDDELVIDKLKDVPNAVPGRPVAFQFHLMSTHGLGKRSAELSPFQPSSNYYAWPGSSPKRPPTEQAAAAGLNYYDNGVMNFDDVVSRLLDELGRKGYLNDALVVITGDHGEMLGERGYFSHQHGTSEQVLNIPLIFLRYGYASREFPSHSWSGQIDIAPTILRELGLPVPDIWEGRALQDSWMAREYTFQQGSSFGVYHIASDGRVLKYERDLISGEEMVSDPSTDPLAVRNLSAEVSPIFLEEWRARSVQAMFNSVQNER